MNNVKIMKNKILLLMLCALLCGNTSAQKTTTYALVLAVQDYPQNALTYTARDAVEFGKVLKKGKVKTSLVTGNNVVKTKVESTIDKMIEISQVKPYKYNFIIYFSGHGGDGIMAFYDGVYYYKDLFAKLAKLKAKSVYVFVDACLSGSAGKDINSNSSLVNPKMLFFSSSRADEYSIDGQLLAHGVFTQALIKGIRGYSDKNKDRIITVSELFKYIHDDVVIRCEKFNELPVSDRTFNGRVMTWNMHPQLFGPGSMLNDAVLEW